MIKSKRRRDAIIALLLRYVFAGAVGCSLHHPDAHYAGDTSDLLGMQVGNQLTLTHNTWRQRDTLVKGLSGVQRLPVEKIMAKQSVVSFVKGELRDPILKFHLR